MITNPSNVKSAPDVAVRGVISQHPWRTFNGSQKLKAAKKERDNRKAREYRKRVKADPIYRQAAIERAK